MTKKNTNTTPVKAKLTVAQLQEIVEKQEDIINKLNEDATAKNEKMKELEKKIYLLEGKIDKNTSLNFVRERVTDELKSQLTDLQQYTRRYSVVIAGVEKQNNESEEVKKVLKEAKSVTTFNDVDKFHRVGPVKNNKQDVIVRFKSHTAKENFYKNRKNVNKNVKIKPSLAPGRKELLNDAVNFLAEYENSSLKNQPHFVFADMHGNLKLKMTHRVEGKMFFKFNSLEELALTIEHQNRKTEVEDQVVLQGENSSNISEQSENEI